MAEASEGAPDAAYLPIAAHGAIGDLRTVALVDTTGSVSWCCLPDLDGPSVFASLLDARRGGRFRVAPAGAEAGTQRYLPNTNVLETTFNVAGGVTVTDFLPVSGDLTGTRQGSADSAIVRIITSAGAAAELDVEWSPRFDYARDTPRIERADGHWLAIGKETRVTLSGVPDDARVSIVDDGATLRARIALDAGASVALVMCGAIDLAGRADLPAARALLDETTRAWRAWVDGMGGEGESDSAGRSVGADSSRLGGASHGRVVRSGLVLKLLTHRHTGAIAAAPTTSLPEEIGGVRNWDYRFSWVRDAAFTAQAFSAIGHEAEARDWLTWVQRASKAADPSAFDLQIMYGLHGETQLKEIELSHLDGYRGSRPVRIGNAASEQFQLDIYGELMSSAYELLKMGHSIEPELWTFLRAVADRACDRWREPDHGIWEVRTEPRHFVYSKVMAWVALDRALKIDQRFRLNGDTSRWRREAAAIRDAVLTDGLDPATGTFRQAFGETHLDAANILIPLVGFLPADDSRVQRTIDRTLAELTEGGVVYRYRSDDGIPGDEGAFVLATFWMVDALTMSGRIAEARALFDAMARRANPLGLFSEQFDPKTGEMLGNFPQAFSHITFINAALHVAASESAGAKSVVREPQSQP